MYRIVHNVIYHFLRYIPITSQDRSDISTNNAVVINQHNINIMSEKLQDDGALNTALSQFKSFNFNEKVDATYNSIPPLNIVVAGKTGVGKSTLINAIFGKEMAAVGVGEPVTQHLECYTLPKSPITIFDSKGIETGTGEESMKGLNEICELVEERNFSPNTNDYIHICWYCVSAESKRFEPNEAEMVRRLAAKNIPVVVVLTQSSNGEETNQLIATISRSLNGVISNENIIAVMAQAKSCDSEYGSINIKQHGVENLVQRSCELLPESVETTLAVYQKVNLDAKIGQAKRIGLRYAAAVGAAAFQPLPLADAPIMISIQLTMMARITACFGMTQDMLKFRSMITALGGPFASAVVGRTAVSLLKLIPGFGTVLGGTLNAATGAALTLGLANIYIKVLATIARSGLTTSNVSVIFETLKSEASKLNMNELKNEWQKSKDQVPDQEAKIIVEEVKQNIN